MKVINVTKDNLLTFGFACFYYSEEFEKQDNYWLRKIILSVGGASGNKTRRFKIPQNLLIALSKDDKIVTGKNFNIGESEAPVSAVKLLSERAGWNQTDADLEHIFKNANNGFRLATYVFKNKSITLGSGLSLPVSEDISWIGMILVHPELRRQGVARSIMHSCLEHARLNQKKSIVGLDATPQGKQVYDALGFVDSYKLWRSVISTKFNYKSKTHVEVKPFDLDAVRNYLIRKNNIERFQIATLLADLPQSKNYIASTKGKISGFILSRPGRLKPLIGPLFSDSNEIALELLYRVLKDWKSLGFEHVFIDIPEYHIGEGSIFSNEEDFKTENGIKVSIKQIRSFIRMYQLISEGDAKKQLENSNSETYKSYVLKACEGYEKTLKYMEKEKNDIIPHMYAIGGPEMS